MQKKTGILLVNLGTPDSPANSDVFKYLNEFLTDGRVIDYPWFVRQLLVRGIIVPVFFCIFYRIEYSVLSIASKIDSLFVTL